MSGKYASMRASRVHGVRARIMLLSPEGHSLYAIVRLDFVTSNNEAEYKTILVGLRITFDLGA